MNEIKVRNPRTGKIDYTITPPTTSQLKNDCKQLRNEQLKWVKLGLDERINYLQAWKGELVDNKEAIIAALITDTGRKSETEIEFDSVISTIDRWCKMAPEILKKPERKASSIDFLKIENDHVPYQLVGIISPWNLPFLLTMIDAIPALLAGSAIIVKPSEVTPRFIDPLLKTIASVPTLNNVFKLVVGAGETGVDIVDHVDYITFTGSVATGKKVAEASAKNFIPASLELGGKDPAIILEDTDLDRAASAILWGSVVNNGQSCLSIERVYVDNQIYDEFIQLLVKKAEALKLAVLNAEDGEIGPIIAEKQKDVIHAHIQDAIDLGATIQTGGTVENIDGGYWCRPTVLSEVNHQMKVMTDETFGPLIPVMRFSAVDEAIELANDSIYGLSGAVFSSDEVQAMSVADQMIGGAISINDAGLTAIMHEGEKSAFKLSGMGGSRMGPSSIKRFLRKKTYLINTGVNDPWWF